MIKVCKCQWFHSLFFFSFNKLDILICGIIHASGTGCLRHGVELVQWLVQIAKKCMVIWTTRLKNSEQFTVRKLEIVSISTISVRWHSKNSRKSSIALMLKLASQEKYQTHLLPRNWMRQYSISCKCFLTLQKWKIWCAVVTWTWSKCRSERSAPNKLKWQCQHYIP